MNDSVQSDFTRYALRLADADGGNPCSPLWIMGIEPGGEAMDCSTLAQQQRADREHCAWTKEDREEYKSNPRSYRYHQHAAKCILSWLNARDPSAEELRAFILGNDQINGNEEEKLFLGKSSCCFLLNLYPLNRHRTWSTWTNTEYQRTGFETVEEYREWCESSRFKKIQDLLKRCHPKVLLCAGRGFRGEFTKAVEPADEYDGQANIYRGKHVEQVFIVKHFSRSWRQSADQRNR